MPRRGATHAGGPEGVAGARSLGWRLVPAGVFRRWNAVGLGFQQRVPHRFHRAVLGGYFTGRRSGPRCARDGRTGQISGASRRQTCRCCSRRLSTIRRAILVTSRAIRRAYARTAGNIRMLPYGRRRPSRCWAMATGPPNCWRCSIRFITPTARREIHRYKVEPYVACADVYSVPPHVGRGGWTWYTGSAGWMYRVALEWLLGFRVQGANLVLDPCIPHGWPGFRNHLPVRYARGMTSSWKIRWASAEEFSQSSSTARN